MCSSFQVSAKFAYEVWVPVCHWGPARIISCFHFNNVSTSLPMQALLLELASVNAIAMLEALLIAIPSVPEAAWDPHMQQVRCTSVPA